MFDFFHTHRFILYTISIRW